ncbi:hypothetical protein ASPSYDRAFT_53248 [Aspergillus sydowii CBS 593.65]|uniref:Nephrocystin 3-like N-terminal domain-containing protein n=1 Tax=Aspergillus sydowii CBS 593.65 TaxID=1036612 RepID=A0A1L9TVZ9_9EURO|nr:uncharacterized protein ASPSYDRAFT_53248 [Aspergillus sydowii CBS 593.65]OJJ63582.1 hypothetical protein ASPSYDRAFT_53248 [Aspergillus sydowii CBS 593.65]
MSAIRYMLDDEHFGLREVHGDPNSYIVGTLSGHNVVITCLPENQGKGAAAIVATNMARTFPGIEWRLLVGIGGGVPSDKNDIRMPEGLHSGVIQYDLGKDTGDAFIRKGYLSPAPSALRSAVVRMRSDHRTRPNKISEFFMEMTHLNAQSDLGDVLCFEMEAAGILTEFPCLVIRGISDYADSHKNDVWHHYAAAAAAGCAKELLSYLGSGFADEIELDHDISSQHHDGDNTSLSQEAKQELLESLRFDRIEARKGNIKSSHTKTCKWLLETPEYCRWLDTTELNDHHGVLWIKGKPGAGKSTLMKFALDNALEKMDDRTVLHFFFNARGEELEKSTIGMYQTLLWQLFGKLNPPAITARYRDKGFRWNVVLLEEVFRKAIQSLGQSTILCFIDALDECEETQIRDMLRFFEDMAELAVKAGIRFNLLFASRHYPHITIKKGLELTLESEKGHSDDIVAYVESELKIGDSNLATQVKIKDEIQRKASGVFMWVVLVVRILNKQHDRGHINTLWQKLQETPDDLHKLFRDILERDDHGALRDDLFSCIQWVLFAIQPLKPVELYCILLFQADSGATNEWNTENITDEAIKKYILDCSKGLAEITDPDPTVQFIHESVRDFLLKEDWLSQIRPDLRDNFEGQSHEHLKMCCLEYMTMKSIPDCLGLETLLSEADRWEVYEHPCRKAAEAFPFLDYAVSNVLHHADMAASSGIMQSAFLESFQLSYWSALSAIFRDDIRYQFSPSASLQYVLADYGLLNLIEACPFSPSWLEKENNNERDGLPLFLCLAPLSKDALQTIMRAYLRNGPPGSKLHELYHRGVRATRHNFELQKQNPVPPVAPGTGEELLFIFMLETGAILPEEEDHAGRTPLEYAAVNGYLQLAQVSLDRERADPDFDSSRTRSALLSAVSSRQEEIVKLLLADWRVDPNCPDFNRERALKCAAEDGQEGIVKLLLADMRVDPNFHFPDTPTALSGAAKNAWKGRQEIVKLLLADQRVELTIQDGEGLLIWAARNGHTDVVDLLLVDRGVDPNIQRDGAPVTWAARNGHEETVKLLLADQRVDPDIRDDILDREPLSWAVQHGHEKIVKLLLADERVQRNNRLKIVKSQLMEAAL